VSPRELCYRIWRRAREIGVELPMPPRWDKRRNDIVVVNARGTKVFVSVIAFEDARNVDALIDRYVLELRD
jgi:hypothetical protein